MEEYLIMYYERTNKIEKRFKRAIELLRTGNMTLDSLAKELDVSRPTVLRIVGELRRRGYKVRSVHETSRWQYELITVIDRATLKPISNT